MNSTAESPPPSSDEPNGMYARWAPIFEQALSDMKSVPLALALLDTVRARESRRFRTLAEQNPAQVVRVAAALFHVPSKRLFERCRQADVTSARYVASWVLRRRHWSLHKIARFFSLDHSTIVHGLRKVDTTAHLLFAAHKAEHLLALAPVTPDDSL